MWLILLIVVPVVIYLVVKSVKKFSRMAISPIDALKSRYSRGEITRIEYEQMKTDLES